MKWFKHDSNANNDAKLKRVKLKHGMEGYGLYWYCLELIAQNVDQHNLTFELEHDAELIAADTGIHQDRIQEIMRDFVLWELFESSNGLITCLKMAARTDEYTQQLMRKNNSLPTNSRQSPDKLPAIRIEENRREQNRVEETSMSSQSDSTAPKKNGVPFQKIIDLYHEKLPMLPRVAKLTKARQGYIRQLWSGDSLPELDNWENFFIYVGKSTFLTGQAPPSGDRRPFIADLEWITKPANYVKILEGKYHG